jgi:hypothetical protein
MAIDNNRAAVEKLNDKYKSLTAKRPTQIRNIIFNIIKYQNNKPKTNGQLLNINMSQK